jgi:hypothetical protein
MDQLEKHNSVGCNVAHLVEHLNDTQTAVGSIPTINEKAKTSPVICERHLILGAQANQVRRNSQGEICLCRKFRSPQGLMGRKLNGKQSIE